MASAARPLAPRRGLRSTLRRLRPALVSLVLFGAAFTARAAVIQDVRFLGDESSHYTTAHRIADFESFPLLGTPNSSGGRGPSPLFYWFVALPQFLSNAPEASMAFIAFLAALCPVMLYDMLRRRFGELGAFLAAATFAITPWPVLSSIRIWDPHVGVFLATLALWSAARVREDPRSKAVFSLVAAAVSLPGIHLGSIILWPGLLWIILPVLREIRWGWFVGGLALGGATYIPGLVSELDTDFENIQEILAMRGSEGLTIKAGWAYVPIYILRFVTTDVSYFLLRGYYGGLDEAAALRTVSAGIPAWPSHPARLGAFLVSATLAVVAFLTAGYRAIRQPRAPRRAISARVLFVSTMITVVTAMYLLGSRGRQIYPHYVIYTIPMVLSFYAVLVNELRGSKVGTALVVGACLVFWSASVDATTSVIDAIDGRCSLGTQRRVLERMYRDAAREGLEPGDPVRFDMTFRCGHGPYNALAEHAYEEPIPFTPSARRQYRLQLPSEPAPFNGRDPLDLGHAVLYRTDRPGVATPPPPSAGISPEQAARMREARQRAAAAAREASATDPPEDEAADGDPQDDDADDSDAHDSNPHDSDPQDDDAVDSGAHDSDPQDDDAHDSDAP